MLLCCCGELRGGVLGGCVPVWCPAHQGQVSWVSLLWGKGSISPGTPPLVMVSRALFLSSPIALSSVSTSPLASPEHLGKAHIEAQRPVCAADLCQNFMRTHLDDDHESCFSVYPLADQTEKEKKKKKKRLRHSRSSRDWSRR